LNDNISSGMENTTQDPAALMRITFAHHTIGEVSMLGVRAAAVMNTIYSVLAIHTSRPDTSLEHTQQREKMLNISSQSMETTDM
jgi:hypothetical protein